MKKVLETLDQLGLALTNHRHKWTNEERKNFEQSTKFLCGLVDALVRQRAPQNKNVKITTEGLMNGTWQIKLTGIKDEHLHDTEIAILNIFGRKKNKF